MRCNKSIVLSAVLTLFLYPVSVPALAKEVREYDVVVIGAGSGGCAAAIQAARMGMNVALLERSDWVGGQMTGAAVSSMDDKTLTRTGIYFEFVSRVRDYYASLGRNVNVCYWGSDTIAFEPAAGRNILLDMLGKAGNVNIIYRAKPLSAEKSRDRVTSAVFEIGGKQETFRAAVFIDATEYGDFIPLTGARWRSGNSVSTAMRTDSVIQDITYSAVVKRYPDGLPDGLRVPSPPPKYDDYVRYFRRIVTVDGSTWPGDYPFNVPTHNAYRAMPDPDNDKAVLGGEPETWANITKTAINWANDYPGNDYSDYMGNSIAMSIDFLEKAEFRKNAEREAMLKTLCFLYYMQNELGMEDWSVDDGQGFGTWFSNDWQHWGDFIEPFAGVLSHFPPFPYVRESRRIIGVVTMTIDDVLRDTVAKRALVNNRSSVALGEYPTDLHGRTDDETLETHLGDTRDKMPNDWQGNGGLFQIPLGVFIPENIDGLLAAEKNISVSRVVNGSTRLQPVTMLTGQAAGAIATLAVKKNVQPRELTAFEVQAALIKSYARLSLFIFADAPEYSPLWPGIEAAVLYEYMEPKSDKEFGTYDIVCWNEVRRLFRLIFCIASPPQREWGEYVVEKDFVAWLEEVYGKDFERYRPVTARIMDGVLLSRGRLAQTIYEMRLIAALPPLPKSKK